MSTRIAVIGDIIIDKYIYGSATRLSPEAPVPIVSYGSTEYRLGGAGNVWKNLISLGIECTLIGDIDIEQINLVDDSDLLRIYNEEYNLNDSECSMKTRIFSNDHYITRIDNDVISDGVRTLSVVLSCDFSGFDYVILSDYNKGVLKYSSLIIEHLNKFGCKVIVDPKKHSSFYEGAWLLKPNIKEDKEYCSAWTGNILVTAGALCPTLRMDNKHYHSRCEFVEVKDATGAGDCFLSAFVYGLVNGYDYQRCLDLATKAASESVKHLGTYILSKKEVESKIIFTNGCFDILHRGHVAYLNASKSLGDKLIVGLNSDDSVRRLKGYNRPINNQYDRKAVLESLACVDEVIIFDEDTPLELIKSVKPDIITKGGDYVRKEVVGYGLAEVVIVPFVGDYSSSQIIKLFKK